MFALARLAPVARAPRAATASTTATAAAAAPRVAGRRLATAVDPEADVESLEASIRSESRHLRQNAPNSPAKNPVERYARALFIAGSVDKSQPQIAEQLDVVSASLDKLDAFAEFFNNPMVSKKNRQASMAAVLAQVGVTDANIVTLADSLARDGQTAIIKDVIESFKGMVREKDKSVDVLLTVATLSDAAALIYSKDAKGVNLFSQLLQKHLVQPGSRVKLTVAEDPSLLAGCTIQVGDVLVEDTLTTALTRAADASITNVSAQIETQLSGLNQHSYWTSERATGQSEKSAWAAAAKEINSIAARYANVTVDPEQPLAAQSAAAVEDQRLLTGDLFRQYAKQQHGVSKLGL